MSLIALDWGTTNLRAYLLDGAGRLRDGIERPLGILNVPRGDFAAALAEAVGHWMEKTPGAPILACGMIGSRQGWREAPYVACPAGLADIAAGLVAVEAPGDLRLVPGVATEDSDGIPDVMRGEETQILGAAQAAGVFVLPGTHSKWAELEGGRIVRFATFMTGEVYAALKTHTILARLMQGEGSDEAEFARGVAHGAREAKGRGGLLHRLFGARTLALFDRLPAKGVAAYLSGLLIGAEIAEATAWLAAKPARVTVIGAPALAAHYAAALSQLGIAAGTGPADATARGLYRIAKAAGLLG